MDNTEKKFLREYTFGIREYYTEDADDMMTLIIENLETGETLTLPPSFLFDVGTSCLSIYGNNKLRKESPLLPNKKS